jgi:hypothetical protein
MLGDGLIWEYTNPYAGATLRGAGDGCSARFDLSACDPGTFQGLDTILTERDLCTSASKTTSLSTECFSMLGSFWE